MSDEIDVETFVSHLGDKQLACRRLGHPWRHHTVTRDKQGFIEVLRCPSCGTRRLDVLNLRGHVISRRYQYADGYQATHVTGGVIGNRDLFRLEALERLVEKAQGKTPQRRRSLKAVG